MFDTYNDLVTVDEMRKMLNNMCKNKAYQLLNSGYIKYARIGRVYLVHKASIIDYVNRNPKTCEIGDILTVN